MLTMIYMFGAHPEHFWILYIIESLYFFPFRMYIDWKTKPLRTIFYEFEYCWIVNFVMFFLFVLLAFAKRFSFHSGVNDAICMNLLQFLFLFILFLQTLEYHLSREIAL